MKFKKVKGAAPVFIPIIILYCLWIGVYFQQFLINRELGGSEYITDIIACLWGVFAVVGLIIVIIDCNSEYTISEDGVTYEPKFGKRKHISWENCGLIGICGEGRSLSLFFSPDRYICYSREDCAHYARKNRKKIIAMRCGEQLLEVVEQYAPHHLAFPCLAFYKDFCEHSISIIRSEKRKKKRAMRKEARERKRAEQGSQGHPGF